MFSVLSLLWPAKGAVSMVLMLVMAAAGTQATTFIVTVVMAMTAIATAVTAMGVVIAINELIFGNAQMKSI